MIKSISRVETVSTLVTIARVTWILIAILPFILLILMIPIVAITQKLIMFIAIVLREPTLLPLLELPPHFLIIFILFLGFLTRLPLPFLMLLLIFLIQIFFSQSVAIFSSQEFVISLFYFLEFLCATFLRVWMVLFG